MQECTDFPGKSPVFLFLLSWVSWQLFFMVETLHKYNKNRKTLLRFPLLHRSCLAVDINTKATNLKLNRKLNPTSLTAPWSLRCAASDITQYYLSRCPPQCFFIHSRPQHNRLQGLQPLLYGPSQPVSSELPDLPLLHILTLFCCSLSFYGCIKMAVHSSILAWEILWTEEPGGLSHGQSIGLQKVRHDWTTKQQLYCRRQWHPTPVLLPGKSHGRRSLVGCSPWGH